MSKVIVSLLFFSSILGAPLTPSSRMVFDPVTNLLSIGVEVNFNQGLGLQIERIELIVPEFTTIQPNPISVSLKPPPWTEGKSLIVIDVCGHRIWSLVVDVTNFPIPPTIVPGYEKAVVLKEPCDLIQLEMHWAGPPGANFEIQGTAELQNEPKSR